MSPLASKEEIEIRKQEFPNPVNCRLAGHVRFGPIADIFGICATIRSPRRRGRAASAARGRAATYRAESAVTWNMSKLARAVVPAPLAVTATSTMSRSDRLIEVKTISLEIWCAEVAHVLAVLNTRRGLKCT